MMVRRTDITQFLWTLGVVLAMCMGETAKCQLILNQSQPPAALVQNVLLGSGIFASNITFNGYPGAAFPPNGTDASRIGRFNGSASNVGFPGGVILANGNIQVAQGPNDLMDGTNGGGVLGLNCDIDLIKLSGDPYWQTSACVMKDVAKLEFDFIATHDMVDFRYVFGSEEYETYTCTQYNDLFGFFLSGPGITGPYSNNAMNIAMVPGSLAPVTINSVNSGMVPNNANGASALDPFAECFAMDPDWALNVPYYRYNGASGGQWGAQSEPPYCCDPFYVQYNGLTVPLHASAAVQCGQQYHVKLVVANRNDYEYASAVFIEQGSFTSSDRFDMDVLPGENVEFNATDTTFIESECDSVYLRFHRRGGFYLDEYLQITTSGSATEDVDYASALPDSIHFAQFDSTVVVVIAVPVDADGLEDLRVTLVTCDGLKLQHYDYLIDQREPLVVELDDVQLTCPETVTLTPAVTGGGGDPAEYTYLWNTGATTPSITVDIVESTQFWVTVGDCWATEVIDSAWVYLPDYVPMVLTMTPDTAIPCLGSAEISVGVTEGAGGYTYEWTLNDQVQGTQPELEVPAANPAVYYVVAVTDACGWTVEDSVLVSQAPPVPLTITVTPDTAIACLGTADLIVEATGGGGELSYTWRNGGGIVGTLPTLNVPAAELEIYQIEVSDQCGQLVSAEVEVTTGPTPPLVIEAQGDTVLCANTPMVLQVLTVSGGGGAYSYAWSPPGTGTSDGPTLEVNVADDSYFTVTVTDECGNSTDTLLLAMVEDHDPLQVIASNDTIVCPGEQVPLWVQVSGGAGGNVITWPGIGTGETVQWTAGHDAVAAVVQVTDVCGETISDTVQLEVYPAQAYISATELGDSNWSFQARTDPEEGNELEWDLGDGTIIQDQTQVSHQYGDIEAHWVYLYMVTEEGCTAVDSVQTTPPSATIYFPNAFSPNKDDINDTFGGEGALLDRYELYVFDRWGGIIFQSSDMAVRWDGTMDGEEVMNGVYQYKYLVKGLKMPLKQGFGHVVLVR